MSRRRLKKEIKDLQLATFSKNFSISADPEDIFSWEAVITPSNDSPYRGGIFFLSIKIPQDYPFRPPDIKCLTKIYHPNINTRGQISADVLDRSHWSPVILICDLIQALAMIFEMPDPEHFNSPEPEIMKQFQNDYPAFEKEAQKCVREHAINVLDDDFE